MATILYNSKGEVVRVEEASRVQAMLENGFSTTPGEDDLQIDLDLGGAQGTNGDDAPKAAKAAKAKGKGK